MGHWAAGHGGLYILPADILSCCGEQHKNLFDLPAAHTENREWWTLGFAAFPGGEVQGFQSRDFWRSFLSRKVQLLIEALVIKSCSSSEIFSGKIYCLEEALLTLFCICQPMAISHSQTHLGVSGPSSSLQVSLKLSTLNGIFVKLLTDRVHQPDRYISCSCIQA